MQRRCWWAVFLLLGAWSCDDSNTGGDGNSFSGDSTVETLDLAAGSTKTLGSGARVVVTQNDELDGTLVVEEGGGVLVFRGNATINGTIQSASQRRLRSTGGTPPDTLVIVAEGDLTFGEDAEIDLDVSLKITDDENRVPTHASVHSDVLTDDGGAVLAVFPRAELSSPPFNLLRPSSKPRQANQNWLFQGNLTLRQPPLGSGAHVVSITASNANIELASFNFTGPDGLTPTPRTSLGTCGGDPGGNGASFLVRTGGQIALDAVSLLFGDGGTGQACTATSGPRGAEAFGGPGGSPGSFKLRSGSGIVQNGGLTLDLGQGGDGGSAMAVGDDGADGCPPMPGDQAFVRGGPGFDMLREVVRRGVSGSGVLQIADVHAGNGGDGTGTAGSGGANLCDCGTVTEPASGGTANVGGGAGGDAELTASGEGTFGNTHGGDAGQAQAGAGQGGQGANCGKFPGGDGGDGGDAFAVDIFGGHGDVPGATGLGQASGGRGGDGGSGLPGGEGGSTGICLSGGDVTVPCSTNGSTGAERSDLIQTLFLDLFDALEGQLDPGSSTTDSIPSSGKMNVPLNDDQDNPIGSLPLQFSVFNGSVERSTSASEPQHVALRNATLVLDLDGLFLGNSVPRILDFRLFLHVLPEEDACEEIVVSGNTSSLGSGNFLPIEPEGNTFVVDGTALGFSEASPYDPFIQISFGTNGDCLIRLTRLEIVDP